MNERFCVRVGALARGRQRSNRSRPAGTCRISRSGPVIRSETDKPEPAGRRQRPLTGFCPRARNRAAVEKEELAKRTAWEREAEENETGELRLSLCRLMFAGF